MASSFEPSGETSARSQCNQRKCPRMWVCSVLPAAEIARAFARHSIKAGLLSSEQLSAVLAEKYTREEWVYLFHIWNHQAGSSPTDAGVLGVCGIVSAIKPSKQVCLEEPLRISTNLNFSDYSIVENVEDDQGNLEESAPDMVFLFSSSSEDKTQEERLEDIIQS